MSGILFLIIVSLKGEEGTEPSQFDSWEGMKGKNRGGGLLIFNNMCYNKDRKWKFFWREFNP